MMNNQTFENFTQKLQPMLWQKARALADGNIRGLLLIGPCGVGKTHISMAVYNALQAGALPGECRVKFSTETGLLSKIRATYHDNHGDSEAQILNVLKAVPMLIIDDLCKYTPQDASFRNRILFELIDYRCQRGRGLLASANNTIEELTASLGDPIIDRLRDMCEIVALKGKSQRGLHGKNI